MDMDLIFDNSPDLPEETTDEPSGNIEDKNEPSIAMNSGDSLEATMKVNPETSGTLDEITLDGPATHVVNEKGENADQEMFGDQTANEPSTSKRVTKRQNKRLLNLKLERRSSLPRKCKGGNKELLRSMNVVKARTKKRMTKLKVRSRKEVKSSRKPIRKTRRPKSKVLKHRRSQPVRRRVSSSSSFASECSCNRCRQPNLHRYDASSFGGLF